MRLLTLTLRNFKGIRDLTISAEGKNLDISGTNATGKTTIFDAFLWLLFDKDSSGKKDFDIKTLDENNQPIHGLEHTVEGIFDLNSQTITLRKVYSEKWTKQRGSATATLTGHTTDYFIDGVPVQLKEYQARIAEIADEGIFKLLTSPTYFNELYKKPKLTDWESRRETLLAVCGDITDADVIASDKALAKLPGILQGRKLDDHKKMVAAQLTKINDELKKIPVRIDEANRSLPEQYKTSGKLALADDIEGLKAKLQSRRQALATIESGGQIAELKKQLAQAQTEQIKAENEARSKADKAANEQRKVLGDIHNKIDGLGRYITNAQRTIADNEDGIKNINERVEKLRLAWFEADARKFTLEQSDTCPTCGQSLPEEQLQAARDKAEAAFNLNRATLIEGIEKQGREHKSKIADLHTENEGIQKRIAEATQKMAELNEAGHKASEFLEPRANETVLLNPNIDRLQAEIEQLQAGNKSAITEAKEQIRDTEEALDILEKIKAQVDQRKQGLARIAELGADEKRLAAEYERLEGELYLCEQFVKTKVALLDEKINSRFKLARFKLFEQQVNGGIAECCETTYKGVPYSTGLNKGHQNAVGMDIISTLSEHYKFWPTIVVDNAESIAVLPEMKAQLIRLIVSPEDKKLRVESV